MIRKWFLRLSALSLAAGLGALALIVFAHVTVESTAEGRIYREIPEIPERKAAVVMGCSRILANGRGNLFFNYRIAAAAQLYHSGKCDYLIVTGDNSTKAYDEPTDMRDALIEAGVPGNKIYRDYAGFRTLDSIVRAKEIFGQEDFIVVSQEFHNERAIYLAEKHGLEKVIALNARSVHRRAALKTRLREYLARVKTILDIELLQTAPRFLGKPVELGGPVT